MFLLLSFHYSEEAECLTKSFLNIINILFTGDHSNPYHKVNIKTVALQLLEFAKLYEENKNFEVKVCICYSFYSLTYSFKIYFNLLIQYSFFKML